MGFKEKAIDADTENVKSAEELSENVDENLEKTEKVLENERYRDYNKNKGSDDEPPQYETLKSRNMRYEGKINPLSGVPYERRVVTYKGKQYYIVVPKFDIVGQATLSDDFLFRSNSVQFRQATKLLYEQIKQHSELGAVFTESQLKDIEKGNKLAGYTWHHDTDVGVMSLVDKDIHKITKHTGGKFLWDGGYRRNRRKKQ